LQLLLLDAGSGDCGNPEVTFHSYKMQAGIVLYCN